MQLHILDGEGTIIGGCSLENTIWRMTEYGLVNESFIKIKWDSKAVPERGRLSNSNGTVVREAAFRIDRGVHSVFDQSAFGLILQPGQFTISDVFWRGAKDDGGESAESKESSQGVESAKGDKDSWL